MQIWTYGQLDTNFFQFKIPVVHLVSVGTLLLEYLQLLVVDVLEESELLFPASHPNLHVPQLLPRDHGLGLLAGI